MAPPFALPPSQGSTVEVSIIDGGHITVQIQYVLQNPIAGHEVAEMPCYSFLIRNKSIGKNVLYDLGVMKAWKDKQPPTSK
jgi:hypothetical protein